MMKEINLENMYIAWITEDCSYVFEQSEDYWRWIGNPNISVKVCPNFFKVGVESILDWSKVGGARNRNIYLEKDEVKIESNSASLTVSISAAVIIPAPLREDIDQNELWAMISDLDAYKLELDIGEECADCYGRLISGFVDAYVKDKDLKLAS